MKVIRISSLVGGALLLAGSLFATPADLPRVQIDGKTYYYYEVKKDDSLYGISKRFGWDADKLRDMNKDVATNLKRGDKLFYPADDASQPQTHYVERGETLYGISIKYGVPTDKLYEANPKLRNGLKAGTTIIIPAVAGASEPEDMSVAAEEEIIQSGEPEQIAIASEQQVNQVVVSADEVDDMQVVGLQTPQAEAVKPESVKIGMVMAQPKGKRDLEFVRGMLTGLDALKNESYKISFKVFDGQTAVAALCDSLAEYAPDLLFWSAETTPEYLNRYAQTKGCTLINVFDVKSKDYEKNRNVVQLMVPSEYFNSEVSEYMADKFRGATLLIVGEQEPSDLICENMRQLFGPMSTHMISLADLNEYMPEDGVNYLIYSASTKKADAEALIKGVNELATRTVFSTYAIMGRPNWVLYDNELQQLEPRVDFYIPSRYYFDSSAQASRKFDERFNEMFNHKPQKSFPIYAVEGYDVMKYFVPAYIASGGDFMEKPERVATLQNNVNLERPDGVEGVVNTGVFMMRYIGGTQEREKISVK